MILRLSQNKLGTILCLLSFVILSSCNSKEQEISIIGSFSGQDTVSITIPPINETCTPRIIKILPITTHPPFQEIKFDISKKELINLFWIQIDFHQGINKEPCVKELRIRNIACADANDLIKELVETDNDNAATSLKYVDKDTYLIVHSGGISTIRIATFWIFQSRPIGLQLILRITFIAILLTLIVYFFKQTSTQRGIFTVIAIFLASLFLKIDYHNCAMAAMALMIIIAFIRNKDRKFTWQPIFYVLCAMYAINLVGLLYTSDVHRGTKWLDGNIPLILFPIIFSMIQFPKKNVLLLLRFFVWVVIAFCLFSLLSYAMIIPAFNLDMIRNSKLYYPLLLMWPVHWHPSFDSTILSMAISIALYLRFQAEKQISFIELLLGISLPIIIAILTGARIGMVIAPVLFGLAYLFYCKFKPTIKWGLVATGIVAFIVTLVLFPKVDDQFQDHTRTNLRKTAISAIKEKPYLGWGTGYVQPLVRSEARAHSLGIEAPYELDQFHNQYLETIVQFGIPGILLLLLLLGWMLWLGIKKKDYLLLSLLTIYVLFMYTESALDNAKGIVPFIFWCCFLVATQKVRLEPNTKS